MGIFSCPVNVRYCPLSTQNGHKLWSDATNPTDILPDPRSGFHEPIGEAIGLALDRGIEHLDRVRIVLVREHGAFRVQYEAGRLHFLANGCRLNPMQRLGVARARPDGGGVVYDDVGPTGLQLLVDSSIEVGRRRAPGLDQRGVEIVVKQVQPQDIRWLSDLRNRHEVGGNGFDVRGGRAGGTSIEDCEVDGREAVAGRSRDV